VGALRAMRSKPAPGCTLPSGLGALQAVVDTDDARPHLLVVPTTCATIAWARAHASAQRWLVGERRHVAGAASPSSYLAECRRRIACGAAPPNALLFSDQFVEAPHAVLLVERDGVQRYLSAIELVALSCHGIDVHVWAGTAPVSVTAADAWDATRVLQAQCAYLDACSALGERWLARPEQVLRLQAIRTRAAIHRIRRYESYLLQAHADSPMDAATRRVLGGLATRRRGLLASARERAC
jgi:hypothetical protein